MLAAAASGGLLAASLPPYGVPALAFVALTPLLVALRSLGSPTQWRAGLRLGIVAGVVMMVVGVSWMIGLLQTFAELPLWLALLLFALFCGWTALPLGLWAAIVVASPRGRGAPVVTALTYVGVWWSWPAVFPFTALMGLAGQPAWIQAAELGGVALVEFAAVLACALLAEAIVGRRWLPGALALALAGLCFGLGARRIDALAAETTRSVRFGLVQPNIPLLWDDKQAKLARLREPSAQAQAGGAEIVVWPENMYPWPLDRPLHHDFTDDDRILALHALPTLFGAGSIADEDAFGHNTVFHMAADGSIRETFDKVLLVPLGERIPLVDPVWATSQVAGMAHNLAGEGPARFRVVPGPPGSAAPPVSVGPLLCYEDVFASFARQVAAQPDGVEVFVNLTNDTWFGEGGEPWGHLALAQFRSVEHRIPMVRSVNSGPSSAIDRAGRVTATTTLRPAAIDALVPPELLLADVELGRDTASAPTPYARGGWLFVHLCQGLAALVAALAIRRARRTRA